MEYAIILLVLGLAVAPLMHFLPSKRQRHQAQLREAAALAGLFVEFRDLPLGPERLARLPASERQVLYYGCRLPASRREPRGRQAWYRDGERWVGTPARLPAPPSITAKLPDTVLAVGVSEGSCGLFWQEQGDAGEVREMAALLAEWRDNLVAS